ncbi:MAG: hypothetical protein C6I01_01935 [Epsilonproteobacteria bacterium]|nr:hypothetical protein [Campylobacterota bacterium]
MATKKPTIKIKKPGSFTEYCRKKGYKKVTLQCIKEGLKSKNPLTRKRALFALNVRKWAKNKKRKK